MSGFEMLGRLLRSFDIMLEKKDNATHVLAVKYFPVILMLFCTNYNNKNTEGAIIVSARILL